MIVFEDELARVVEILPNVVIGDQTAPINFGWGTEAILSEYLVLKGRLSFPLIWLVEDEDTNNEREPSVTRNAQIVIIHESQAPYEFNPYQHAYDYKLILQPILDNLLIALRLSGISRYDDTSFRTRRVKKYSMRSEDENLQFICNAIVLNAEITFSGVSTCIKEDIFN